jgi:hypothetical protein
MYPDLIENNLYEKLEEKAMFTNTQLLTQTRRPEENKEYYERQLLNLMGSNSAVP